MQIHNLKRKTKNKKTAQVGRGGTRGKTSGRGTKGQNARAGHKKRPELRDFIKRLPKLRGRGKNSNTSIQTKAEVISLTTLDTNFSSGAKVTPAALMAKGIITLAKGKTPKVKILGGNTDKKLIISDMSVSASVKAAVEKAGGSVA